MYVPSYNRESDKNIIHDFIFAHSFGVLVTTVQNNIQANHFPFLIHKGEGEHGVLYSHLARANPQWKSLIMNPMCLVLFHGPHRYISPSWYAEDLNVPTWNYTAVQATCSGEIIEDSDKIEEILKETVITFENHESKPWTYTLPEEFKGPLKEQIVGLKLTIAKLEGKFKLSQNRNSEDFAGVVSALEKKPDDNSKELLKYMKNTRSRSKKI